MVNIVLVHGAIADGSSWSHVIPLLQAAGHYVLAVQQPLTSIDDDIAKVKVALGTIKSGPIVLVGHSFGGIVITEAAHNNSNISALVYVAAFAPDQGESVAELGKNYTALPSNQHFVPDSAGRLVLPQDLFLKYFAPDVDQKEAKIMAAAQGPCDAARFGYVSGPAAWKEHPSYYIVAQNDQIIQPEMEAFFAERMKAKKTVKIPASHAVLVSHPKEVADLILEAANAVGK
ncbi:MAG: Alpha/Beta hydrolase protein [Linnemannia elongata]|nr:MAG: Alpha/Beta hydrolase protein [Linnemannia elongata]